MYFPVSILATCPPMRWLKWATAENRDLYRMPYRIPCFKVQKNVTVPSLVCHWMFSPSAEEELVKVITWTKTSSVLYCKRRRKMNDGNFYFISQILILRAVGKDRKNRKKILLIQITYLIAKLQLLQGEWGKILLTLEWLQTQWKIGKYHFMNIVSIILGTGMFLCIWIVSADTWERIKRGATLNNILTVI